MPQVHKEGKDTIIFASKEDHSTPSNVELPEPEPAPGLLLPNGEINWNCPCLGGMATGPCGLEFREAFNCFHLSNSDPKGAECTDLFRAMHVCITEYPALYGERHPLMDDDYDEDDADKEHNIDTSTENRVPGTQTQLESKREDAPSMKQDLERTNVN